jgi:hypothetical protein
MSAITEEQVDPAEEWLLPFSLPSFRAELGALATSVQQDWQRWAEQAVLLAGLAKQVPSDGDGWGWKSFVREVAVARRCSDQAAAKEVFLAVALVSHHPRTLALLRAGRMPMFHARVLLEESTACDPAVSAAVDAELAERACLLTPSRIRDAVRKIQLRVDADAAAARAAKAATARNVRMLAERDDQASLVLTGPVLPVARFYEALTKAARAARAAGDARGLDALRFDLALDLGDDPAATPPPTAAEPTAAEPSAAEPTAAAPSAGPTDHDHDRPSLTEQVIEALARDDAAEPAEERPLPARLGDRRRVRPTQVLIHLPVTTALGLDNEPGWLPGYGWVSAPQCREWMVTAELRQVCVGADGTVVDSADRLVRPVPTPQGAREAVLAMVADPGEITEKTYRQEPQHDPSDALRSFVDLRDRFCDGPTGTRVPAERCDRDHEKPYPQGPTAAWNLKARAGRTHQLKHRGWTPLRLARSTLWFSPAGQIVEVEHYAEPPPGLDPHAELPDPDELHRVDAEYLRPPTWDDLFPWGDAPPF